MVHLGALGSVVRSTALLPTIHRRYPKCRLIWVTDSPAHQILRGHPMIDQVLTTSDSDLLELASWNFEIAMVIDKSRKASGVLKRLQVDKVFGFQVDPNSGAVVPATKAATELWEIGLSDHKKFFENKKSEGQLVHESLELGTYLRQEYCLPLSRFEQELSASRKNSWSQFKDQPVIGINTGASDTILAKKFTVEYQRKMIGHLFSLGWRNLVLLGGPEDTARNRMIAENSAVIQSPTDQGLRDGLCSVDACDIVISGDSLGMHMAIARRKFVIAWFGPTCAHEIDLFDRGEKILAAVDCGPCWKRVCEKPVMCYDRVSLESIESALKKGISHWQTNPSSSSRRPSLVTSY